MSRPARRHRRQGRPSARRAPDRADRHADGQDTLAHMSPFDPPAAAVVGATGTRLAGPDAMRDSGRRVGTEACARALRGPLHSWTFGKIERMLGCLDFGHDGLGGPMPRRRTLFWTIAGSVVAAVAVVIALIQIKPGALPKAASSPVAAASPVPQISARADSQAGKPAPVIIPRAPGTSSFSYISDLIPSSNLRELIYPGPVTISGSIYPKSISFYCDDGDLPAFPAVYKLKHDARRFDATVGVEAKWPPHYLAGV